MNEKIFASVYLDECIPPILAELLNKEGWIATSAIWAKTNGKTDSEQLYEAIKRKSVLVTADKKTFLKKVTGIEHKGIIIIHHTVSLDNSSKIASKISQFLNHYTYDEFENLVLFIT